MAMYVSAALIDIEGSQDPVWLAFFGSGEESPDHSPTLIHRTHENTGAHRVWANLVGRANMRCSSTRSCAMNE